MDPKKDQEQEVAVSDDDGPEQEDAESEPQNPEDDGSDYDDDDDDDVEQVEDEEDDTEERYSARAQPPSRSRSPIEVEVLSSDDEEEPPAQASSQTARSSSPKDLEQSSQMTEEEDPTDEDEDEEEEMQQEVYESYEESAASDEEQSEEENRLHISEQDREEPGSPEKNEEVEEMESEQKEPESDVDYQFSKPFEPTEPLDLPVMDPLTQYLMDSVEELKVLPDYVLTKLTNIWASKDRELKNLREQLSVNSEEASTSRIADLEETLQSEVAPVEQTVEALNDALLKKHRELKILHLQRDGIQLREKELLRQLRCKDEEVQRIVSENASLSAQLNSAITSKCDALLKMQNIEGREIQLNNKEWRLDQENASYRSNLKNMTEKLDLHTRELTQLKHETSVKITDLEIQLRESKKEAEESEKLASYLKEALAQKERKVENLQEKLRDVRDAEISLQEAHNQEIQAKTRMAKLYEEQTSDSDKIITEYIATIKDLQSTVKEAVEKCGELETRAETEKASYEQEISQKNKMIFEMRDELKRANELIEQLKEAEMEEQVSSIAPSASTARHIINSKLSFTEIYNMYKTKENELALASAEIEHLKETMELVVREVEEKAPIISKDKEILNMTQAENERILGDYDKVAKELVLAKEETRQIRQNAGLYKRDNERKDVQIADLSKQVVVLLREVEALTSRRPMMRANLNQSFDVYASMTPSQMLTQRLVPFRDIEELQSRNLELLAIVRDLTQQAEEAAQMKESGMDLVTLSNQLEKALEELKELKDKEKQHTLLIEQLTEQRNQFREISQSGKGFQDTGVSPMKFDASPMKRTFIPSLEDRELKAKLLKTQESLAKINQEFDSLIKERSEESANYKKEIEKLKQNIEDKNIAQAKLNALCENREGKLANAQDKVKELTKQIESLESKCKAQTECVTSETKKRQELLNEMNHVRCNLNRCEATLSKTRTELESARSKEEALKKECETWKKSFEERGSIQASVEQMRLALERSRNEGSEILIRQLDEARLEAASLRKRLQEETKRYGEELNQLKLALDQERENVLKERASTEQVCDEKLVVQAQLSQALRDVQALRAHRNPSVDSSIQTEVFVSEEVVREKIMAQRASEYEVLVESLKSELDQAKKKALEFKNIADATERSSVELKEALETAQTDAKQSKETFEESEKQTKLKIEQLVSKLAEAQAKVQTASAEATHQLDIVKQQLQEVQAEKQRLQYIVEESQVLKSALAAAEEESRRIGERLTHETEQNMKNMESIEALKCEIIVVAADKAAVVDELEEYKRLVSQFEIDLEEKERCLAEANSGHELEKQQIKEHNEALHNQLQTMGAELSALKQGTLSERSMFLGEGASQLNLSNISVDDSQSSEQLMQVIKHLRREKDSLSLQCEEFRVKWAEAKARSEALDQQLEEAARRSALDTPEGPELVTRARYEELLRKIEMMDALSESAKLKREACTELQKANTELETRIRSLLQEVTDAQAQARKYEAMAGSLQADLVAVRGETERWRTCANQLTEKANQANPEELKRLLQERENLQKQLHSEREALSKEREEGKKIKAALAEKEQQLTSLRTEATQTKTNLAKITEEHTKLTAANKELGDKHKDLASKELTVRRIAKKYKTQYDNLLVEVKKKEESSASSNAADAEQIKELQEKLKTSETRAEELESKVQELEAKIQDNDSQYSTKQSELDQLQEEINSIKQKGDKLKEFLTQARKSIAEKNNQCEELKKEVKILSDARNQLVQHNDEYRSRTTALQSNYEGKIARLEKEKQELLAQLETLHSAQQHQPQQDVEMPKVQEEKPQSSPQIEIQASTSDAKSLTRTANVPPLFTAQGRGRGQSVVVTPTTRGTPTALLKPMQSESGQVQAPTSSAVAESSTSSARAPTTTVRSTAKVENQPVEAASTSMEGQEDVPTLLVRPHEVHPAVSSSQTPAASSHSQAAISSHITLKRTRDSVSPMPQEEEPRTKQLKSEVDSASAAVEEIDEEPSSSHNEMSEEDVIFVEDEYAGTDNEMQANADEEAIEDVEDEEEEDEESKEEEGNLEGENDENEDGDEDKRDGDGAAQKFLEKPEEEAEGNADEDEILTGEDQTMEPQEGQVEDVEDDNEVLIEDEEESAPAAVVENEPPLEQQQVNVAVPLAPVGQQPPPPALSQHHAFEELGDFGIVPSTPTLFARQNVFSEAVGSAPQVPQVSAGLQTQEAGPSHSSAPEAHSADRLEVAEESTGRSVPTTPLMTSPPENIPEGDDEGVNRVNQIDDVIEIEDDNEGIIIVMSDQPSSSSAVPSISVTAPAGGPVARGVNRARRSGGNFGPGRARAARPTPIVWEPSSSQQQQQQPPPQQATARGRASSSRARSTRSTRGGNSGSPFTPLDFM
ncbi:nucleoprotein TPR isoform X2 [Cloeon dipterum]|uniref:nucleoprotein TPR isoform X2 n=1 Tax=Cloeon dipterum TaxID=197152 RepID=UPI003220892E